MFSNFVKLKHNNIFVDDYIIMILELDLCMCIYIYIYAHICACTCVKYTYRKSKNKLTDFVNKLKILNYYFLLLIIYIVNFIVKIITIHTK